MRMEDIARLANVSKSAVSLALSGKPGVSESTRAKILNIVKDNGYIPRTMLKASQAEAGARILRFVACTNSGIVLEQYDKQPFFAELIHDIEEQCRSRGYSLLFSSVPVERFEETLLAMERERESSGMILLGTNLAPQHIESIAGQHDRLVVLDTCCETLNANFIVMNNVMGAHQAGRYLLELGHRQIGYVQSDFRMYNFDARKQGFRQALAQAGLSLDERHVFTVSPTTVAAQQTFQQNIAALEGRLPTALFCECDYIAISVIKSLAELSIRVPEDISVVGFDNIRESTVISPELTTVHVEKSAIAELAVTKLLDSIAHRKAVKVKSFIDTQLVVRNSCRAVDSPR
ncbi:LacI family DNA-binding transcriptional regulator [Paenibacillus ginsengihumi]|uniref:LacI family DNA-binding transcriptional regulator n=1 Tax=Paenibacillus ginsengihumi TaxID=431596 RepID=UPI00047745C4|nr:LacI family DNA-binding transcriptional regulator [Paenibacillus ginsengihumi]